MFAPLRRVCDGLPTPDSWDCLDSNCWKRNLMPQLDPFAVEAFSKFSASLVQDIESAPMPSLGSGPGDPALGSRLANADWDELWVSAPPVPKDACLSGLWLLAGELDRSHTISQAIKRPEGSFWHGIMHRREGDFSNAKYWFRQVGSNPLFQQIADLAPDVYRDPFDFVDRCAEAIHYGHDDHSQRSESSCDENQRNRANQCKRAQWMEWQAVMAFCIS